MLRVVLDTNVLVSATISNGKSRELFQRGLANRFAIVTSDLILEELVSVLSRPQLKTTNAEIKETINALKRSADVINVKSKLKAVKEDPKDDMIIETAYDGNADIIVTGDKHLLALQDYKGIRIITVQSMLELI
ncbi:MAG: putative toxin-antitoxin system toxin component, PIN family [Candidatus Bathyarchaeia archaeon]|jgi:putative PIN family toxin of toxin-antitoxin system